MRPRSHLSIVATAAIFVPTAFAEPSTLPAPPAPPDALSGGGAFAKPTAPCAPPELMAELNAKVEAHWAEHPPVFAPTDADTPIYWYYPMGGTQYRDLFTGNFNDLAHPKGCAGCTDGLILDFDCTGWTYDGHDATDTGLRSFAEQLIGVPVFAARDGVVVDAHDGEPDMNVEALGQMANYCVIDHGEGIVAYYLHFKKDSVLVEAGDTVVAGQPLALTGSSGNSTGPHLHFATYRFGERFEPYVSDCNTGTSGWWDQVNIPRDFAIDDAAISTTNIGDGPFPPFALARTGQVPFDASVRQVWIFVRNVPNDATWTLRTVRPDGEVVSSWDYAFGHGPFRRGWYWFAIPSHSDLQSVPGTWEVRIELDGEEVQHLPFQVTWSFDPSLNHVPESITAAFDPPMLRADQPLICRIDSPLVLDDLDYEVLSYRYEWSVNGVPVRDVVVAGHADVLDRTHAVLGATVTCSVTPMDAFGSGATAMASATIEGTLDCNGNGIDDLVDIGAGTSADGDLNDVPDECESPVLYVDAAATGAEYGVSWNDAYTDLQTALAVARSAGAGGPSAIWVAAGTYLPDAGSGDRNASFDLVGGVAVLGGFAGNEVNADDRDPIAHPTILSGDLAGDDGPDFTNRLDNAFWVVAALDVSPVATLDGFTVRGGYADGGGNPELGAAAHLWNSEIALRDCVFTDSRTANGSGVLFRAGTTATVERCSFLANLAGYAAGSTTWGADTVVHFVDCRWADNEAEIAAGALNVIYDSTAMFTNCIIESNRAPIAGAIRINGASTATFVDTIIRDNESDGGAGAAQTLATSTTELIGCTVEGNRSIGWDAGAFWVQGTSTLRAHDTVFMDNEAFFAGGAIQSDGNLELVGCQFVGNVGGSDGGAMRVFDVEGAPENSIVIEGCLFDDNRSNGSRGGAIAGIDLANLVIDRCRFTGNRAPYGGAIYLIRSPSDAIVLNSVFDGNSATIGGGGVCAEFGGPRIVACSFHANIGPSATATWAINDSAMQVIGCAIGSFPGATAIAGPGTEIVRATCVVGGYPGVGNIDADPLFRNPAAVDFSLLATSPCIDAGDTDAIPAGVVVDFLDGVRITDTPSVPDVGFGGPPVVDMGAIEFVALPCEADLDGDGTVGFGDLVAILSSWGPCATCEACPKDIGGDGDCLVGFDDLIVVLQAWGACDD